jgi:hypothetical protein
MTSAGPGWFTVAGGLMSGRWPVCAHGRTNATDGREGPAGCAAAEHGEHRDTAPAHACIWIAAAPSISPGGYSGLLDRDERGGLTTDSVTAARASCWAGVGWCIPDIRRGTLYAARDDYVLEQIGGPVRAR